MPSAFASRPDSRPGSRSWPGEDDFGGIRYLMATRYSKGIYADPRWVALRDKARKRAGCTGSSSVGKCEACRLVYRLQCHHRHPLHRGGQPFPALAGVVMVCRRCHALEHRQVRDPVLAASQLAWDRLLRPDRQ